MTPLEELYIQAPVHTTSKKFEYGGFTLKTHQIFCVHTTLDKFKNITTTGHFGFVFEKSSDREITGLYPDFIVFKKHRFLNVSCPHENEKPAFSNSSRLKNVFEKLRFRDGLAWIVGITLEKKATFSNLRLTVNAGLDNNSTAGQALIFNG